MGHTAQLGAHPAAPTPDGPLSPGAVIALFDELAAETGDTGSTVSTLANTNPDVVWDILVTHITVGGTNFLRSQPQPLDSLGQRLAQNPTTPSTVLAAFGRLYLRVQSDRSAPILKHIGGNPNTDAATLAKIVSGTNSRHMGSVWAAMASNPNLTTELIGQMARDSTTTQVLERLAARSDLTATAAETIADDDERRVLNTLLTNPVCPAAIAERFAFNAPHELRGLAVRHPSLSNETLVELTNDGDDVIAGRAWAALNERGLLQINI